MCRDYIGNSSSLCDVGTQFNGPFVNAIYGYNHYVYTPSQFNDIQTFFPGLVPAIVINDNIPFYVDTRNHSYSDYYCFDNELSENCKKSFKKLNNYSNWKLLIIFSSNFLPYLSKSFSYNITFYKIYTNQTLLPSVNLTVNNSLSTTIQFYNTSCNTLITHLIKPFK